MRSILLTLTAILVISLAAQAAQVEDKVADRLYESSTVLDELVNAPDGGIPTQLLKDAKCVGVIPAAKKAAFWVGTNYGRGVVS